MKKTWRKANEFTMDCFNKWGYHPYQAILSRSSVTTAGILYDATILKHIDGSYIPCTGGLRLQPVKLLKNARAILNQWLFDNTGN